MIALLAVASVALAPCGVVSAGESEPQSAAAAALCRRVLGDKAADISFELAPDSVDSYRVSARSGRVVIAGNNANSMAVGLNRYLMEVCHSHVSWWAADTVRLPKRLPVPGEPLTGASACKSRFFLNYCTFGYTLAYWQWADWERLIDWMALNGINMPLAITGQESVWLKVWQQMGLKKKDVERYFTGPAHLAWHRMANVDYFQGPLPQSWHRGQEQLQKRILQRERELCMTPVLPAFAGHVPGELAERYPNAKITPLTVWGGFDPKYRSHFLDPDDPLYAKIQKLFVTELTKTYGTDHIYGIDPFNELDSPDWSEQYLAKVSSHIYSTLRDADPQAQWLQMTWTFFNARSRWTNPRVKAFLDAVPKDRLINLDYYCDYHELWPDLEKYFGGRYLWCYLGNFGGNTMTEGNIADVERKLERVMAEGGPGFEGVGATLEGFDTNAQMYEYVFRKVWQRRLSGRQWFGQWALSRGGVSDTAVVDAWQRLRQKVYVSAAQCGRGTLISARPSLTGTASTYCHPDTHYPEIEQWRAWTRLVSANGLGDNPDYLYDVANWGRQALGNIFAHFRAQFAVAYTIGDVAQARVWAGRMDTLIADFDRLVACERHFSMGAWVAQARALDTSEAEADYFELNARTLLTTWGQPGTALNDYAARGWSGLTATYCRPRWRMFTAMVIEAMEKGRPFSQEEFNRRSAEAEYQWTLSHEAMPVTSGENALRVARELIARYQRYAALSTLR